MAEAFVRTPDGQVLSGPEEDLGQFLATTPGAQRIEQAQANELIRTAPMRAEARTGTAQALQAVAGFTRGALFGLPVEETIERAGAGVMGYLRGGAEEAKRAQAEAAERLRIRAEENAATDIAAEMAGFGASAIATGSTTAGARALATGARVTQAAGNIGARAATAAASKTAGTAFARALESRVGQSIARGMTEGAGLAVAGGMREVATDEQLSAEYVASHITDGSLFRSIAERAGTGALIGGPLAGAFTGLGIAARAAADRVGAGTVGGLVGSIGGAAVAGAPGAVIGGAAGATLGKRLAQAGAAAEEIGATEAAKAAQTIADEARVGAARPAPGSTITPEEAARLRNVPTGVDGMVAQLDELMARAPAADAPLAEREAFLAELQRLEDAQARATVRGTLTSEQELLEKARAIRDPNSKAGQLLRKQLTDAERNIDRVTREVVPDLDAFLTGTRAGQLVSSGSAKLQTFAKYAAEDAVDAAAAKAAALEEITRLQGVMDRAGAEVGIDQAKNALAKLTKRLEQEYQRIGQIAESPAAAGEVAFHLDNLKREIGAIASAGFGMRRSAADQVIEGMLRDEAYNGTRALLESADVFGSQISTAQELVNDGWTKYLTNFKGFKTFTSQADRDIADPFMQATRANPRALSSLVQNVTSVESQLEARIFQETVRDGVTLMERQLRFYEPGAQRARMEAGIAAGRRILRGIEEAAGHIDAREAAKLASGEALDALMAQGASAIPLIGKAVEHFADVQKRILMMSATERLVRNYESQLQSAVSKFVGGLEGRGAAVARTAELLPLEVALRREGRAVPPAPTEPPAKVTRTSLGQERADEAQVLRQMATVAAASQPQRTQALVAQAVTPMASRYDDRLAVTTANAMARAIAFLGTKVPPAVRVNQDDAQPQFERPRLSDVELARWRTYVQTVKEPLSVVDDLAAGTVSREQAETLRVVYPAIYSQIQTRILEALRTSKRPIAFQQRVQLFQLFGAAVDPALSPAVVAAVQQTYTPAARAQSRAYSTRGPGGYAGTFGAGLRLPTEERAAKDRLR
jgi:hypothetical protein